MTQYLYIVQLKVKRNLNMRNPTLYFLWCIPDSLFIFSGVYSRLTIYIFRGVFQTLVDKHFPAPDRKKTFDLFGERFSSYKETKKEINTPKNNKRKNSKLQRNQEGNKYSKEQQT